MGPKFELSFFQLAVELFYRSLQPRVFNREAQLADWNFHQVFVGVAFPEELGCPGGFSFSSAHGFNTIYAQTELMGKSEKSIEYKFGSTGLSVAPTLPQTVYR